VFYETVAQLDAQPVIVQGVPDVISGETYDVVVDGSRFIGLIFQQLYRTQAIPFLPRQIYGLHNDNSDVLFDALVNLVTAPQLAYEGMGVAVECADIAPENEQAGFEAAVGVLQSPVLRTYFETLPLDAIPRFIEACALWGSFDEDPQANLPVSSDIPTLIFAGEFDPITPPVWGQRAAESLPNSFFYEVPGHGHGVTVLSACPVNVMKAFLNEPTEAPNSACIPRQWVNFR
jgi:pimeloyl-ACP methyl ester carboxylesterase